MRKSQLIRPFQITVKRFRQGQVSHETATIALIEEIERSAKLDGSGPRELFALSKFLQEQGFFLASLRPYRLGLQGLISQAHNDSSDLAAGLNLLKSGVFLGDKNLAGDGLEILTSHDPALHHLPSIKNTITYATTWLGGETKALSPELSCDEKRFEQFFSNKRVTVYGPGPTDTLSAKENQSVAEILIPASANRLSEFSTNEGVLRVGYANGETTDWLLKQSDAALEEQLKPLQGLVLKSKAPIPMPKISNIIRAVRPPEIFTYGAANMAQFVLLDVLRFKPQTVFFEGVTFFLGSEPYRISKRRYRAHTNETTDQLGSLGAPLERCRSIAAHAPQENWRLVKNLEQVGLVDGDSGFRGSIDLTDEGYLNMLDLNYGSLQR